MSSRKKCAGIRGAGQGAEVKLNSKHKKGHETVKQIKINRLLLKRATKISCLCVRVCAYNKGAIQKHIFRSPAVAIEQVVGIKVEAQQHMLLYDSNESN